MKTPVRNCHPYSVAKKWANRQNSALYILHKTMDLIHQVCYDEVLGNSQPHLANILEFMGVRDVC